MERFDAEVQSDADGEYYWPHMQKCVDGEYVRYSDVEALIKERDAALLKIEDINSTFEGTVNLYKSMLRDLSDKLADMEKQEPKYFRDGLLFDSYDEAANCDYTDTGILEFYERPVPEISVPDVVEAVAAYVESQVGDKFSPAVMASAIRGQLKYGDVFKCLTANQSLNTLDVDKLSSGGGMAGPLWSDSHDEGDILERNSNEELFTAVVNLWEDVRCLKENLAELSQRGSQYE